MKRVLLIILFVICTSNYSFGQPKDVEGWNKVRWGMTENEVLKVFEGKAIAHEGTKTRFVAIDEIEIGKDKYKVYFKFDDNDKKLINVSVCIKDERPTEFQFSSLEKMLAEKYGAPSFTKDDRVPYERRHGVVFSEGSDVLERAWYFPSTIIELKYFHFNSGPYTKTTSTSLFLIYKKKEARENL